MNYSINKTGLAEVSKLRRKNKRALISYVPIWIIMYFMLWYTKFGNEPFSIGSVIFTILVGGIFMWFLLLSPLKKTGAVVKNIIHQIDIQGNLCVFKFSFDSNEEPRSLPLNIPDIEVIPANKGEISIFSGKNFIVFNILEERIYFIDEFWEESALILDQLDIENEISGGIIN